MKILTSHPQWNTVVQLSQKLRSHGYQTVVAGGAVRDALRGIVAKDIDLATSAPADKVLSIVEDSKYVGEHFGVVIVDNKIEVASFRKEGLYSDGRHPDSVELCTIEEDVLRRDFTINAMYFDPVENKIIDLVGGQEDLKSGILRTVGKPQRRFEEDHLRILRAYRFQAKTGFVFESSTQKSIVDFNKSILKISKERIQQELTGLLSENFYYSTMVSMFLNGSLEVLFPKANIDFNSFHFYYALNNSHPAELRLAVLLYKQNNASKVQALLRDLKFSNQFIKSVTSNMSILLEIFDPKVSIEEKLPHLQFESGKFIEEYLKCYQHWYESNNFDELISVFYQKSKNRELPKAVVDGKFLINLGLKPGPDFEYYIQQAYVLQLKGVIRNTEDARFWVQSNLD